ncbi:hypothetical protein [Streptomyces sp. NPDC018059]|uniref:hypothetical protein n=1 Tax=Streptomyces sp. NPDC018059 TaxID=3365041 RepID=UPI00378D52DA
MSSGYVAPVRVGDDFFEFAAGLRLAIDQESGAGVPAAALFLTPTVEAPADAVEAGAKDGGATRAEPGP